MGFCKVTLTFDSMNEILIMWPFKWKLSACTFTWCHLFLKSLENEMWNFGRNLPLATFGSERVIYYWHILGLLQSFIHVYSNFALAIQLLTVKIAQCIFVHLTQFGKIWSCSSSFFCYQVVWNITSWVFGEKALWSKNMLLFCTNTER